MLCPECLCQLNMEQLICKKGHQFEKRDGIYILLNQKFKTTLDVFLSDFEQVRNQQKRKILDKKAYEKLPYFDTSFPQEYRHVWIGRQQALEWMKPFFYKKSKMNILNFSSWNGWLSNNLINWGHELIAISYFVDEWDGLAAMKHYRNCLLYTSPSPRDS